MIPTINNLLSSDLQVTSQPSKNYAMQFEKDIISGFKTQIDAMEQVIFKILNTERYQYGIYSKNYGIELNDLYGQPVGLVIAEVENRITQALIQDDRIDSVDTFEFITTKKNIVQAKFIVHTSFGDLNFDMEVSY